MTNNKISLSFFLSLIVMVVLSASLPENTYSQSSFFMRYDHPNVKELDKNIDEFYKHLSKIKAVCGDESAFQTSIELGEMLTVARREKDAIQVLKPLLKCDLSKVKEDDVAWLYLNYATAGQYLLREDIAKSYFKKSLKFVRKHKLETIEHYVLHHYARFLVEQCKPKLAEKYFKEALLIRKKLGEKRAESTQKALDTLKELGESVKTKQCR